MVLPQKSTNIVMLVVVERLWNDVGKKRCKQIVLKFLETIYSKENKYIINNNFTNNRMGCSFLHDTMDVTGGHKT